MSKVYTLVSTTEYHARYDEYRTVNTKVIPNAYTTLERAKEAFMRLKRACKRRLDDMIGNPLPKEKYSIKDEECFYRIASFEDELACTAKIVKQEIL